jgi:hypothetical protein
MLAPPLLSRKRMRHENTACNQWLVLFGSSLGFRRSWCGRTGSGNAGHLVLFVSLNLLF